MPVPMLSPRPRAARPLSPQEWGEAERVAARLRTELGRLIEALPEHARHASGMSRHLNVLRATCQRVVQALQEPSPAMLARLPGVEGLRQFLGGMKGAGADGADVESAESAVESFERLITLAGGSQTKLAERLEASAAMVQGGEPTALATTEQREALYHAASSVTGRRCDTSLSIYAFRQDPKDPTHLWRALAKGLIGSVVTPGGLPMVLSSGDTLQGEDDLRRELQLNREALRGRTPEAVLRDFSTDPLPMVTSRSRPPTPNTPGKLYQVIDPKSVDGPIDVVTALLARHPMYDQHGMPTLDAVWSLVSCPSAALVLDVYLHADMERLFRPSIDALLWTPDLNVAPEDRWVMRLPHQPKLQLLGRGTPEMSHVATPLYPRHAELTRTLFSHIGWDAEEFVGFRCEVPFPVWRAGYCMGFEFLGKPHGA